MLPERLVSTIDFTNMNIYSCRGNSEKVIINNVQKYYEKTFLTPNNHQDAAKKPVLLTKCNN